MAAPLFIRYFGIMSLITPPIATAAFVAATIAKTDPMAAGWTAMRFGWASYIVPFLFVYSPALIMRGSAVEIGPVMIPRPISTALPPMFTSENRRAHV